MRKISVFLVFLHVLLAGSRAMAQVEEHVLIQGSVYDHVFTLLKNGSFLILWQGYEGPIFQCFDSEFRKIGEQIKFPNYGEEPEALALSNGGFFVYFRVDSSHFKNGVFDPDYRSGPREEYLYGQFFDKNANPGSEIIQINSKEFYSWGGRSVERPIELQDGRILFLWDTWQRRGTAGRLLNSSGDFLSEHFYILDEHWDDAVELSNGLLVLFAEPIQTLIPAYYFYDLALFSLKESFQIGEDHRMDWALDDERQKICTRLTNGNFLLSTLQGSFTTDKREYIAYMFDKNFTRIGEPLLISEGLPDIGHLIITTASNGKFIVKFDEYKNGSVTNPNILYRLFEATGQMCASFNIGFYPNMYKFVRTFEPIEYENDIFLPWDEDQPYLDRRFFYIQKFNLSTSRLGAILRMTVPLYWLKFIGISDQKLCLLGDQNGVTAYLIPLNPAIRPLQNFALTSPQNDETVDNCRPWLHWSPAIAEEPIWLNEVEYKIYCSTDPTFATARTLTVLGDTLIRLPLLDKNTTYFLKIKAKNYAGEQLWSVNTTAFFVPQLASDEPWEYETEWDNGGVLTRVEEENETQPQHVMLVSNYPNPFNPSTTITFEIPRDSFVSIKIYDLTGRLVRTLVREQKTAGVHSVLWDATDASGQKVEAGVYLYQIEFTDALGETMVLTRKMSLVK